VKADNSDHFRAALQFKRFRIQLIDFFKLPLDVNETTLRVTLRKASQKTFEIYLERASRLEVISGDGHKTTPVPPAQRAKPAVRVLEHA
jgi:hypothetical protein